MSDIKERGLQYLNTSDEEVQFATNTQPAPISPELLEKADIAINSLLLRQTELDPANLFLTTLVLNQNDFTIQSPLNEHGFMPQVLVYLNRCKTTPSPFIKVTATLFCPEDNLNDPRVRQVIIDLNNFVRGTGVIEGKTIYSHESRDRTCIVHSKRGDLVWNKTPGGKETLPLIVISPSFGTLFSFGVKFITLS